MFLWAILFVVVILIGIIAYCIDNGSLKELDASTAIVNCGVSLAITAIISLVVCAAAPKQFIPETETMYSQTVCESITITPNVNNNRNNDNDYFNMEYRIKGNNSVSLSLEIPIYGATFSVSDKGYCYFERYAIRRASPVRDFLYGSWIRPRYYYIIYLVDDTQKN